MSTNEKTQQFFTTIEQFINKIFLCPGIMYKHIDFMRCYPDVEWFNVAAILLQKPDAVFVKSKAAWDEYCDKDVLIKKAAKSIRVAVPEKKNNLLQFSLIPLFDIKDINYKEELAISSPIKIKVDQYEGIERMNKLFSNINTSLSECLTENISKTSYFKNQDNKTKKTILGYVMKSVESLLNENIVVEPLEEINNALELYSFISNCIQNIPFYIDESLEDLVYREKEKETKEEIFRAAIRSIDTRKRSAFVVVNKRILNTGKEVLAIQDDTEIDIDEEDIPIPTEREVYG